MKKIIIDRPTISMEEIERFKDFQSILYKHIPNIATRPFYRNIWLNAIAGIALISIFVIWYWTLQTNKSDFKNLIIEKKLPYVNPPVSAWDIPYQIAFISNQRDTVLHFASGAIAKILKNCMLDENDHLIIDSIEIRFREISSPPEIFLSGINMEYDSAGIRSVFESAGMIDIRGFHNHRTVTIKPERPIAITLVSKTQDLAYNLYYLDTVSRNWIYKGKDVVNVENDFTFDAKPEPTIHWSDSIDTIQQRISLIQAVKPEPPKLADQKKWHFTLDLIKGEFPELDVFETTLFEIDETYKPLNKKHPGMVWENVSITLGNKPLTYFVGFKNKKDSCKYLARPVFGAVDFPRAQAQYDSSYNNYQRLLVERHENEAKLKEMADNSKEQAIKRVKFVTRTDTSQQSICTIQRSFTIQNFGIWNCDKSRIIPFERQILPTLMIRDTAYKQTVFLADDFSNSLTSIYPGNPIKFNERAKNTLWMVTYDNKVAVFTGTDFRNIPKNTQRYTLNMRLVNKPIRNAEDFIKLYKSGFSEL